MSVVYHIRQAHIVFRCRKLRQITLVRYSHLLCIFKTTTTRNIVEGKRSQKNSLHFFEKEPLMYNIVHLWYVLLIHILFLIEISKHTLDKIAAICTVTWTHYPSLWSLLWCKNDRFCRRFYGLIMGNEFALKRQIRPKSGCPAPSNVGAMFYS